MKKSFFKTLLTSAVVLGSVATPVATLAQDFDAEIGSAEAVISNLTSQQAVLVAQLNESYAQLEAVNQEATKLQGELKTTEEAIKTLETEIAELEVAIAERQALIDEQARAVQASGGTTNYVNVVASAKSVSDFVGRADVVKKLVNSNKSLLDEQVADKQAVETKKSDLETAKEAVVEQQVALEALKGELEVAQANNEAVYNQLTSDISLAQANRDALVAQKVAFEQAQAAALAQAQVETTTETTVASETEASSESTSTVAPTEETTVAPVAEETTVVTENGQATEVSETTVAPETVTETTVAPLVETTVIETTVAPVETTTAAPVVVNNSSVVDVAAQYLGTPYVWGGKNPGGFDCSGFAAYVYKQTYGINIGGWTVPQEDSGTIIPVSEAQAGDLYFWGSKGSTYHVAIATGNGNYIHAPQTGDVVKYSNVSGYTPSFAVRVRR